MATKFEATDLEQIEAFRRLHTQLSAGLAQIDKTMQTVYVNDLLGEQGQQTQQDPIALKQNVITSIMSLRRVSVQFVYTMKDVKERAEVKGKGKPETHTNGVAQTSAPPELPKEKPVDVSAQETIQEQEQDVDDVPEVEWKE